MTLASTGQGSSGRTNAPSDAGTMDLAGSDYATAVAQLGTAVVDLGPLHPNQPGSATLTVTNAATGALTDLLEGGFVFATAGPFSVTGTLGAGLAAGASASFIIGFSGEVPIATYNTLMPLAFTSHDPAQPDVAALGATVVELEATVQAYATAGFEDVSAPGTFAQSGTAYTLNLGSFAAGSSPVTARLGVLNTARSVADALSGRFAVSGSAAFANAGLAAFAGLDAGEADTAPTVTLSTTAAGSLSETITLYPTGSNSSGYSGALTPETLTITGMVLGALAATAPATTAVGMGQTDPIAGLSLSEAGAPTTERLTATLSDSAGVLTANGAGVVLTGSGTTSLTISGPLAQVSAALGTVKDTEAAATSDTLTLTASDATGNLAAASVAVTVNAAPVMTGPATAAVGVGQADLIGSASVSEAGLTAGETFTVTASDQRGLLAANGAGGAMVSGTGTTGGLTIAGTLAQVNAALATLTDTEATTAGDKIQVFVTDSLGNHAHAASIAVTVNGPPAIAAPTTATVAVDQATAIMGVSLSESGNTNGESFTVTVSDTAGLLSASGSEAAMSGAGTTNLTISGALAQVNAALATLTDTAPGTAPDSIVVAASDSYGSTATAVSIPVAVSGVTAPAATASIRATALHYGAVTDPSWGTGEYGVTVSLLNSVGAVIATAVTNTSGRATFSGLAAGTYALKYTAPAGQGFMPGGPDSAAGVTAPITIAGGQSLIGPGGNLMTMLVLNGSGLDATPAPGGYLVTGNAADSTLTLGGAREYVTLTGGGDTVTTGNGNQTIKLSGTGNTVSTGVGNIVIDAGSGNAVVHAAGGVVTIMAAGGGNLLDGGSGLSFLNTDGSADNVFMLGAAGTPTANLTTVTGFNPAAGDILDLKHTLAGIDILPDLSNLASFITAAAAGPNTVLLVDPTGGHAAPTAFATLVGAHVSVAQLQALHEFSVS